MKTVINIKTDKEVKEEAQKLARELGVPLSTIVNVYLKQFIRTKEFTFSLGYTAGPELEKTLEEVEKDIVAGRNMSPAFETAETAIGWLRKETADESKIS